MPDASSIRTILPGPSRRPLRSCAPRSAPLRRTLRSASPLFAQRYTALRVIDGFQRGRSPRSTSGQPARPAPARTPRRGGSIPEDAIRALVFDFDGLILDTETAEHQAWQEIYRDHGAELPFDLWALSIGTSADVFDPCEQLERQLGEIVDRERLRARRRARSAEILADRSILPGVTAFIDRARELGLALGVASSSSRSWVEGHLRRLALEESFDALCCSDDVCRVKPDPELYLSVCRVLGVEPRDAIAIEDSPNGISAAKAAGLYCVSVPNALTRSLSMDAADLVLVSLATVTLDEVIERAGGPGR